MNMMIDLFPMAFPLNKFILKCLYTIQIVHDTFCYCVHENFFSMECGVLRVYKYTKPRQIGIMLNRILKSSLVSV